MNNKYIWMICLTVVLVLSGCKKDFEDINSDPNSPNSSRNAYLLTGAQKGLMDNMTDTWWGGHMGNQLAQFWSSNQYSNESRYQFRTGVINTAWRLFYAGGSNDAGYAVGGLKELQTIIDNCTTSPDKYKIDGAVNNQIAVANILQVWIMQMNTDTWGDVPYSQAFKSDADPTPAYDKQRDIYIGMLAQLDNALATMTTTGGPVGDQIYGGNMSKWRKFANSLKLKVAMRMADREPALAATKVNEAVNDGVFTSNADNALFNYVGGASGGNLCWYNYDIDGRNDFASSNIMVDYLASTGDSRMYVYFAEVVNAPGTFVGEVYGLSEANAATTEDDDVSQRGEAILSETLPGVYMQYAEVAFFLAEAVERGFVGGSAASYYDAGVAASFDYWGATPSASFLAAIDYNTLLGSGKTWKQVIGAQKWCALYNQGMEAWTEWRRLDFGILQAPADGPLSGSGVPKRISYPVEEQTLNGVNYSAAVSSMGADNLDTKVWWDAN